MFFGTYTPYKPDSIELCSFLNANILRLIALTNKGPQDFALYKSDDSETLKRCGLVEPLIYLKGLDRLLINMDYIETELMVSQLMNRCELARLWAILVQMLRGVLLIKGDLEPKSRITPKHMVRLNWQQDVLTQLGSLDSDTDFDSNIVQVVIAGYLETTQDSEEQIWNTLKDTILAKSSALPSVFRVQMHIVP